jgi:hypothetical protein
MRIFFSATLGIRISFETRISNQHDVMDREVFSPKKTLEHDKMTEYEAFVYLLD